MRAIWIGAQTYIARYLRPLSPVHGGFNPQLGRLTWVRRSRIGADRWTGLDIPLGEAREFYRVRIYDGNDILGEFETAQSQYDVPPSLIANAAQAIIQQGSDSFGFGPPLIIPLAS